MRGDFMNIEALIKERERLSDAITRLNLETHTQKPTIIPATRTNSQLPPQPEKPNVPQADFLLALLNEQKALIEKLQNQLNNLSAERDYALKLLHETSLKERKNYHT